jgi:hypothetical protein
MREMVVPGVEKDCGAPNKREARKIMISVKNASGMHEMLEGRRGGDPMSI